MKSFPALIDLSNNQVYPLAEKSEFLAGRLQQADLVLQHVSCSRRHFKIVRDAGVFYVEPLAPENPTWFNGRPVTQRTALTHNSTVQAGVLKFQYLEHDPTPAAPLPPTHTPLAVPPAPVPLAPPPPPPPAAHHPSAPVLPVIPPLPPVSRQPPPSVDPATLPPGPTPLPPPPPLDLPPLMPPPPPRGTRPSAPALPPLAPPPVAPRPPAPGVPEHTVMATPELLAEQAALMRARIPLQDHTLVGREHDRVNIHLPHSLVSRLHAQISRRGSTATVVDLRSANGTFVNGVRIQAPTTIHPGSRIDIGPYSLLFTGDALVPQSRENNIELIGRSLTHAVPDRSTGKARLILDDISVVIKPRELVCLLGPSGSGKSTLLSALSARAPASGGAVLVNSKDLYSNFEILKQDMAVVPQKDLLHDTLTVEQALSYTARLRLPPDTSNDEVDSAIDQMLDTVGLQLHRKTPIRSLSGGQLKRASLANELLSKPTLLFLDEVTSGLDEQTDREMMRLFRQLADAGKTVLCITHTMANVERNAHLVIILTVGGKLAFVGPPDKARKYFEVERLGDVYEKLAEKPAEEWQAAFRQTPYFQEFVEKRLPPEEIDDPDPIFAVPRRFSEHLRDFVRQTQLLCSRHIAILRSDWMSILATLGQSLLVALLLVLLFGDLDNEKDLSKHGRYTVMLLFLLQISCFWFGCNNAAKEIVKERGIYARERAANLLISSYYASKFVLLTFITVAQTLLVFALVWLGSKPPGNALGMLAILLTLSMTGVALGLLMSAASKTSDMAVTLIPIALIPQIILADVIRPVDGVSKLLAQTFITSYWANRGLTALLPKNVADAAFIKQESAETAYLMLVFHALVFITTAVVILVGQDRMQRLGPALTRMVEKMRTRQPRPQR